MTDTPQVKLPPAKGRGCRECPIGKILPLIPGGSQGAYLPGWGRLGAPLRLCIPSPVFIHGLREECMHSPRSSRVSLSPGTNKMGPAHKALEARGRDENKVTRQASTGSLRVEPR